MNIDQLQRNEEENSRRKRNAHQIRKPNFCKYMNTSKIARIIASAIIILLSVAVSGTVIWMLVKSFVNITWFETIRAVIAIVVVWFVLIAVKPLFEK